MKTKKEQQKMNKHNQEKAALEKEKEAQAQSKTTSKPSPQPKAHDHADVERLTPEEAAELNAKEQPDSDQRRQARLAMNNKKIGVVGGHNVTIDLKTWDESSNTYNGVACRVGDTNVGEEKIVEVPVYGMVSIHSPLASRTPFVFDELDGDSAEIRKHQRLLNAREKEVVVEEVQE